MLTSSSIALHTNFIRYDHVARGICPTACPSDGHLDLRMVTDEPGGVGPSCMHGICAHIDFQEPAEDMLGPFLVYVTSAHADC